MAQQSKRLHRSRGDRKLAGVLGGIAEYLGVDPSLVRIAYTLLTVFTLGFPGVLIYLLVAFIVPGAPEDADWGPREPQ
jgi:phage shock protein C